MNRLRVALTAGILAIAASSAFADTIPYNHVGTVAPTVATYATGNGINVYFYGSGASYIDYVRVDDITSGYISPQFFNNHTAALGSQITIGAGSGQISAGDQLIFLIDTPTTTFGSSAAYSSDGINHAYVTTYSGGTIGTTTVPAGIYVGLEDVKYGSSDLNYQDDTFVFTGVSAPSIAVAPEPSSLLLLGTGLMGITGMARRRFRRGV